MINHKPPKLSVIIPAYNVEPWIKEAIYSIIKQDYKDLECLVINDGSTDNTYLAASSIKDPRLKIINQTNKGVSSARNLGIKKSKGQFIYFLDGDDMSAKGVLKKLIKALEENPTFILSWGRTLRFEDKSKLIIRTPGTKFQHTGNPWHDYIVDSFFGIGSFCIKAKLCKKNLFNESLKVGEDIDWILRVLKGNNIIEIPVPARLYRQRNNSAISDIDALINNTHTYINTHIKDDAIPKKVKKRAMSAISFYRAILYFKKYGPKSIFFKNIFKAFLYSPLYLNNYIKPAQKVLFRFLPKKYLNKNNAIG